MINRSHFILFVEDQPASRQFYEAVLAVAPSLDVPGMTEFQLGGECVLGLMPITSIRTLLGPDVFDQSAHGAPRAELYLQVQDPESCHQRAIENGAREVSPLSPRSWGHEAAYSIDPDGHLLAFACPTRPTTAKRI